MEGQCICQLLHMLQFPVNREARILRMKVIFILRVYATTVLNLLKPTGHAMHQQFNIQQLYVLPTPYLCVLYLYENKQRLVPLTA